MRAADSTRAVGHRYALAPVNHLAYRAVAAPDAHGRAGMQRQVFGVGTLLLATRATLHEHASAAARCVV